jgi:hypothetical protein
VEGTAYNVMLTDNTTVAVSDLEGPEFFRAAAQGALYDKCGTLTAPFTISAGGYAIINNSAVYGKTYPAWKAMTKLFPASRTFKRLHGREALKTAA